MSTNHDFIDTATQIEIIQHLSEKLKNNYIFPEIAEQICEHIQMCLNVGEYVDVNEGNLFALALTMSLQEVAQDEHLWVRWHNDSLPDHQQELWADPEWRSARKQEAELANFGLNKLERLSGNVGYLDIHYFHRPEWGGEAVVSAMQLLSHTNAIIFDLSHCTGGYPGMVALICSYLFGEEAVHLDSIYWLDEDFTQQYWTLPYVPGIKCPKIPVYVLTSKTTFSAGEEFAFILQSRKRAVIIGEKTDGGVHPGASFRIHSHFEAFIPIGRTIDPITGADREGCGITPDIMVPQEKSFNTAYREALQSLLTVLSKSTSETTIKIIEEIQTAIRDLDQ
jgi:hypothetical protein